MQDPEDFLGDLQMPTDTLDSERIQAMQQVLIKGLQPVRPVAHPLVFAAAFLAILISLAGIGMLLLRNLGWNAMGSSTRVAVFGAIAAASVLLAISLSAQMVPGSRVHFPPILTISGLFLFVFVVMTACFQVRGDRHFLIAGLKCLGIGVPFAIPAALLFGLLLRRGTILSQHQVAATVGMLAGLAGTIVLEMHCPILDLLHILCWHLGIPAASALLGYFIGLRMEREI